MYKKKLGKLNRKKNLHEKDRLKITECLNFIGTCSTGHWILMCIVTRGG